MRQATVPLGDFARRSDPKSDDPGFAGLCACLRIRCLPHSATEEGPDLRCCGSDCNAASGCDSGCYRKGCEAGEPLLRVQAPSPNTWLASKLYAAWPDKPLGSPLPRTVPAVHDRDRMRARQHAAKLDRMIEADGRTRCGPSRPLPHPAALRAFLAAYELEQGRQPQLPEHPVSIQRFGSGGSVGVHHQHTRG